MRLEECNFIVPQIRISLPASLSFETTHLSSELPQTHS